MSIEESIELAKRIGAGEAVSSLIAEQVRTEPYTSVHAAAPHPQVKAYNGRVVIEWGDVTLSVKGDRSPYTLWQTLRRLAVEVEDLMELQGSDR